MRRSALALLVLAAGCRSLLGYEDPALVDASLDAPRVGFAMRSEGADEMSGTIAVKIALSAPAADTVTVHCRIAGGTAKLDMDFQGGDATVSIAAGQMETTLAVTILADADEGETDETIELELSQPVGAALGDIAAHTINISSIILPRVSFAAVSSQTLESTPTLLAINLDMPAVADATIVLGVAGGTPGLDYGIENNKAITIPRGTTSVTVPIGEVDDQLDEDDEPITFQLLTPSQDLLVGTIATTTHTITDNDPAPGIGFATATSAIGEAGPSHTLMVALSTESGKTVSVDVALVGGSASPTDAMFTQQTLVFAPGETMKSIVIDLANDALDEDDETVVLGLVAPVNATPTTANHTVTLADDDPTPVISYAAAATTSAEGIAAVTLTVNLSAPSGRNVSVPFALDGATTAQSGTDFSLPASPLVFTAGQTAQTITVNVLQDTLDEFDELVVVDLGNPTNALLGATTTHSVTITDDDGAAVVAFDATQADRSVLEGDAGTAMFSYDVVLDRVSGKPITVPIIVSGNAITPNDFSITTALPLVFQPGQTRKTLTYTVVRDNVNETDDDIVLTIDPNPTNALRGAPNIRRHTILDDD